MKKQTFMTALSLAGLCLLMTGCATTRSGPTGLTTADYMDAAQAVSSELLVHPSITQFAEKNDGRQARLDLGKFQVSSSEPISVENFTERVMEALLDSGQVTLVARDEAAVKAWALDRLLNDNKIDLSDQADFYFEGNIVMRKSRQGGVSQKDYTFMLRLNNRQLSQVWKRTHDITLQDTDTNKRGRVSVF